MRWERADAAVTHGHLHSLLMDDSNDSTTFSKTDEQL